MAFVWSQSLSVGVPLIDDQHKEIFARVGKLMDAASHGKGKEQVGQMLEFLGSYVVTHFGAEERQMTIHGYPGIADHKEQHQRFLRDFASLSERFKAEGATSSLVIAIQQRVCDWLLVHIARTDKALGDHLLQRV